MSCDVLILTWTDDKCTKQMPDFTCGGCNVCVPHLMSSCVNSRNYNAKINTSDWKDAPFLTLWAAYVLPSCREESPWSEKPKKMIKRWLRSRRWTEWTWRIFTITDSRPMSCAWGNYRKHRLSERDCFPLMWSASLGGLLWQLVDGVTENKWAVFSWCWYGEEGANWVHRKGAFPKQWEDCALCQRTSRCTVRFAWIWALDAPPPTHQPSRYWNTSPGLAVNLGYFSPTCSPVGSAPWWDAFIRGSALQ